ncbi:YaiI/YqxD family protein [Stieleria varia]|uniref:UPF0178 protein Pla52n_63550 n=1 Tax=Stieleria varia TaxID=2528005 RepID=A0A5C5ZYH0_9BACT|nr:DUF188 domain-containing protein [Stieleria varia]TWT92058.1 hypothetical protein Pla52n_63550 [Stieleria varia]
MKIWVDADAAPTEVKEIVFRASKRLEVKGLGVITILVANRSLATPPGLVNVQSVRVSEGADEADRYIAKHALAGELAITADIPLAGMLVEKGVHVIDPRGDEYSPANIASRLSMRDFMDSLRGTGVVTGGSKPYGDGDKKAFAATFDRLLSKMVREHKRS